METCPRRSFTAARAANAASGTTPSSKRAFRIRRRTRRWSTSADNHRPALKLRRRPTRVALHPRPAVDSASTRAYRARVMRVADQCDVVVIGAGPAGSTAAQTARLVGWTVVLLHRATAALACRVAAGEHAQPDHNGLAR